MSRQPEAKVRAPAFVRDDPLALVRGIVIGLACSALIVAAGLGLWWLVRMVV